MRGMLSFNFASCNPLIGIGSHNTSNLVFVKDLVFVLLTDMATSTVSGSEVCTKASDTVVVSSFGCNCNTNMICSTNCTCYSNQEIKAVVSFRI